MFGWQSELPRLSRARVYSSVRNGRGCPAAASKDQNDTEPPTEEAAHQSPLEDATTTFEGRKRGKVRKNGECIEARSRRVVTKRREQASVSSWSALFSFTLLLLIGTE